MTDHLAINLKFLLNSAEIASKPHSFSRFYVILHERLRVVCAVGHLIKYLVGHLNVGHVKTLKKILTWQIRQNGICIVKVIKISGPKMALDFLQWPKLINFFYNVTATREGKIKENWIWLAKLSHLILNLKIFQKIKHLPRGHFWHLLCKQHFVGGKPPHPTCVTSFMNSSSFRYLKKLKITSKNSALSTWDGGS